jgi:hypothetical protein
MQIGGLFTSSAILNDQPLGMPLIFMMARQLIFGGAFDLLLLYGNRRGKFEYYVPFILTQVCGDSTALISILGY